MDELSELLRASWGSEQWILEGWNRISTEEKKLIKGRMDELFKDGLPFELKHDKILYIYTFSLLAQLEVLAIQVPLKFEAKMSTPEYKERMRVQLLDEIFHGMVFTKIVYLLCAPQALPPAYNENIEVLCNFIRQEECPKVAIVLLNLIGEGWIEEIFTSLQAQGIAPEVFATIIDDEHRHVCEADLYRDIGLPEQEVVRAKLEYLEGQLLNNIFSQYKYTVSVSTLLGMKGAIGFLQALNNKHNQQLAKLGLQPSENWLFFMKTAADFFPKLQSYSQLNHEIPMTPIRKVFMTQWDNPRDPTMVGQFNINITMLDFFNKKFPPETLTTLMLQAISQTLTDNPSFRNYLSHNKLYQSDRAYVGLVVKLPDCADHIGTIVFENCHELSVQDLAQKVRIIIEMMVFCFKKREQLEQAYPFLVKIMDNALYDVNNGFYSYPIPGNSVVSLSNIGLGGYIQCKSPLRCNEAMKVTLMQVERKPVWNKEIAAFEAQDLLPVSVSADHRVFDGNVPMPKLVAKNFEVVFKRMLNNSAQPLKTSNQKKRIAPILEQALKDNLELTYKSLTFLQTYWLDFWALEELLNPHLIEEVATV